MIIYGVINETIKRELEKKLLREIIVKPIFSIWDLEVLESIYEELER